MPPVRATVKTRGLNHMGHEGLVGRVIGGHIGLAPQLQKLIREEKILAYNYPQGVISTLFRNLAARKPGLMSYVGLGTFIDPRLDGGKLNQKTKNEGEDLVKLMEIEGHEILFYKLPPINVAIVRGTTADMDGNITMEREAMTLEVLPMAMAAKNSSGIVIVQVERIADRGALNPQREDPRVSSSTAWSWPGPKTTWQTCGSQYNPALHCEFRCPRQLDPPDGRPQDHRPAGGL